MIRALFSRGQCGLCVVCTKGRLEEVLGDFYELETFCSWRGGMENSWRSMGVME